MSDLTTFGADVAVDALKAQATHVALFTAAIAAGGSMTSEVTSAAGYARLPVTWTNTVSASESNTAEIVFTATGGDWGNVTHVGIVTSGVHGAGSIVSAQALTATRAMTDGSTITFPIGSLVLQGGVIA